MARGQNVGAMWAAHSWLKKARTAAAEHFRSLGCVKVPCEGDEGGGDGRPSGRQRLQGTLRQHRELGDSGGGPVIARRAPSSPDGP